MVVKVDIKSARLELTNRCNLGCPDCYRNVFTINNHQDMPIEEWQRIIVQLAEIGVEQAKLIGGEIFLRRDLSILLSILEDCGIMSSVITNGTLLNAQVTEMLCRFPSLRMVSISLDGVDEDTNARIRTGFFGLSNIRDAIQQLSSFLQVSIGTTVRPDNLDSVKQLIEEAATWGASYVHLQPVMRFFPADIEASTSLLKVDNLGLSTTTHPVPFSVNEIHRMCQILFRSDSKAGNGTVRIVHSPSLDRESMELTLKRRLIERGDVTCIYLNQYVFDHQGFPLVCPFIRTIPGPRRWWHEGKAPDWGIARYKDMLRTRLLPICDGCCGLTSVGVDSK